MLIRSATAADIPAIIAVELSAGTLFEGTHMAWAVGETSSQPHLLERIDQRLVWVSEIDGNVAGYLCGAQLGGDFHIEEVAVSLAYQRQGVGRRLLENVAMRARDLDFDTLTLTTDRTLPWNAPYYERLGFSIIADADLPMELRNALAEKPDPHRRCAMAKRI